VVVTSFQPNKSQSKLFTPAKTNVLHFALALAFSSILIIADAHYHCMTALRHVVTLVTSPLQYVSDYPLRSLAWLENVFSSKQALLNENTLLRQQQLLLNEQLQRMHAVRQENQHLKDLLSLADFSSFKLHAATILAMDVNSARQIVILNKGLRDDVFLGQPVLDAKGLLGQVIDVGLLTSTVLLVSDSMSAVPIRNNRTDETSILVGANSSDNLYMVHLPKTSRMLPGDLLVTSGLGQLYPEGYPVGRVAEVMSVPGEDFIKVRVKPIAAIDTSRLVLLLWPDEHQAVLSHEINARLASATGGYS
jgi:rod shape-determining protein MreC